MKTIRKLVEQLVRNQQVTGSNPVVGSSLMQIAIIVPPLEEVDNIVPLLGQIRAPTAAASGGGGADQSCAYDFEWKPGSTIAVRRNDCHAPRA